MTARVQYVDGVILEEIRGLSLLYHVVSCCMDQAQPLRAKARSPRLRRALYAAGMSLVASKLAHKVAPDWFDLMNT
jgi:hypothetical protein